MAAELDLEARTRLLDALSRGMSQRKAADHAGYSHARVKQLLQTPQFLAELEDARGKLSPAVGDEDVEKARKTLLAIMAGEIQESAPLLATRIAAAKAVISLRPKVAPPAAPAAKIISM